MRSVICVHERFDASWPSLLFDVTHNAVGIRISGALANSECERVWLLVGGWNQLCDVGGRDCVAGDFDDHSAFLGVQPADGQKPDWRGDNAIGRANIAPTGDHDCVCHFLVLGSAVPRR